MPLNSFAAYSPSLRWKTIETRHFLVHYHNGLEQAANTIADQAEELQSGISDYFQWQPKAKTHIVVSDQSETPNGSATVFPTNRIEIFMAPPSEVSGLEDYQDWKNLVIKHEYVHIIHLDKAEDFAKDARKFVGRHWLLFPNTFLPRWMTEGIATYIETDGERHVGRGQSSYFRGLMRNEVINGVKPLEQINQYRTAWPGGTGFYLYGVYFFNFIRDTYGDRQIQSFIEEYSRFPIPYFINTVAKRTFNKDMYALWDDFEVYLRKEFSEDIELHRLRLRNTPKQTVYNITDTGYFSGFSKMLNEHLFFIRSDQENNKQLVDLNTTTQSETVLLDIKNQDFIFPQSFDVHPEQGILIPLMDVYENYRQSFDLYSINQKTGVKIRLTSNKRYIKAVWNPAGDKIIALGNHNGLHSFDLLSANGKFIKTLWQGSAGYAVNAFDWSPKENKLVVSLFTPKTNPNWNLYYFHIPEQRWQQITNTADIESYPVFSRDGSHIIFSADYDRIYNVYQMNSDLSGDKQLTQLSDTLTVALFPVLDETNNKLYYTSLDKRGFNLKSTAPLYSAVKNSGKLTTPLPNRFKTKIFPKQNITKKDIYPYSGLPHILPPWWLPFFIIDKYQSSFGVITGTNDPLNWHSYRMMLLLDTKNQNMQWNINYLNQQNWIHFLVNSRKNNYYSPSLNREEIESSFTLIFPYIKQNDQWQFFTSAQYLTTQLKEPNSSAHSFDSNYHALAGLTYNSTSKNSRSVVPHSGIVGSLSYEINKVKTTLKQHSRILFDTGLFSSHFHHTVFELRGVIIGAGNEANVTYLGGAQSNFIQDAPIGSNNYSLKGYNANQFSGTNLQKVSLKMHRSLFFPETGIMRPPLGLSRINLHAFYENARVGSFSTISSQNWLSSIALELSFKANFGYGRWPFDISLGVSKGLDSSGENQVYACIGLNLAASSEKCGYN